MTRALWYIAQLIVITLTAVWLVSQEGTMTIQWMEYTIRVHIGLVLFLVFLSLIFVLFLHKFWIELVTFPKKWKRYRQDIRNKKGHESTMRAFVSLAAGDVKHANYHAYRAGTLLSDQGAEQQAIPLLLQAHTARLQGREQDEKEFYQTLFDNKETTILGLQGLARSLIERGDDEEALLLARQSEKKNHRQPWILKLLYDLEIRTKDWESAIETLKKATRRGVISKEQAQSDQKALFVHLADLSLQEGRKNDAVNYLQKAHKIDPVFIPMAIQLASVYLEQGKRRKAVSIIEKAWKATPHPDLVPLWFSAAPNNKPTDPLIRLRWFEKLSKLKPDSVEGRIAVAGVAIEDGLWGEARHYLLEAEQRKPSARIYRLLAELEDLSTHDDEAARHWIEKASHAPADKCWVCRETGHIYERWYAIAEPYGIFNTIVWDYPDRPFDLRKQQGTTLLEENSSLLLSGF